MIINELGLFLRTEEGESFAKVHINEAWAEQEGEQKRKRYENVSN
jgi:hypothetical protein